MRQRAADDFDFINKRLLELQGKKQEQELIVTKSTFNMGDIIDDPLWRANNGGDLTKAERFAVAKMFNCQWRNAANQGCGRNSSKVCLLKGRCSTTAP